MLKWWKQVGWQISKEFLKYDLFPFLWGFLFVWLLGNQFSSVAQSWPTLCDPMDCSTPGLPIHHQLPEFTQTYNHRVGDAIQPSHPLLSPSLPTLNLSQHPCFFPVSQLFASGGQSIGVSALAPVPPMNTQDHRCIGLSLDFMSCYIDLYLLLCQYQTVLITVAL